MSFLRSNPLSSFWFWVGMFAIAYIAAMMEWTR